MSVLEWHELNMAVSLWCHQWGDNGLGTLVWLLRSRCWEKWLLHHQPQTEQRECLGKPGALTGAAKVHRQGGGESSVPR